MAQSGDFLVRIKEVLEGKDAVVKGLQETQQVAQKISKTKITTTFDKEGLPTGKKIEQTLTNIGDEAKKAKPGVNDLMKALSRAAIVAPVWLALRSVMMATIRTIQEQAQFLIDLETAMTRIKIVGKGTAEEYNNLKIALVSLASAYGTTASEAAEAAVLFAQQGKSVKETIELTRTAMLASQILGTDLKTAVDDMTAAMEGFGISAANATSIVDKWINVEKQFAVTSKDLADATKVAGASANQMGVTISEFLGDVTAVVEVTRKSGNDAARGLSFLYARLYTTAKTTIEQITKIPFYLDKTGEATNTVTTEMRSVSDIIGDLAGKWDGLTKAEKLQIATSLGSKRQMVTVNALMQNYNASIDARIASLTSAGSAEKAFALTQETTAIKLKQVSAAWNVLTTTISDTKPFKDATGFFEGMLLGFSALINYEKGYSAVYTKEINKMQLANETRSNEIKSIQELIDVREKLSKAPKTEENLLRLKTVNDALDSISKKEPRIKVALETGNVNEVKSSIEKRLNEISMEKIRLSVSLQFEPKIAAIQSELEALKGITSIGLGTAKDKQQVIDLEKQLKQLYTEQETAITDQYKAQKGLEVAAKAKNDLTDEDLDLSAELTEQEEERLNIERELIKIRYSSADSLELQIQREMELVSQAETLYDAHEKNLKLEELNNKLIDARLQKRKQEENSLMSLSMQYETANMFEKSKIRRTAELQMQSPEQLAATYEGSRRDKILIQENISQFTKEQQDAIARTTSLFKQLSAFIPTVASPELTSLKSVSENVNNNFNIPITLQGAITNENINELVKQIEEKIKAQPNYIGERDFVKDIELDSTKKKKLANALRGEM